MTREETINVLIHELKYAAEGEEFVLLCSMPEPDGVRAFGTKNGDCTRDIVTEFHSYPRQPSW